MFVMPGVLQVKRKSYVCGAGGEDGKSIGDLERKHHHFIHTKFTANLMRTDKTKGLTLRRRSE